MIDPVLGFDWAEHWRRLVRVRSGEEDEWAERAPAYAERVRGLPDALLPALEPYLGPAKTVIDAGAGTGRHAIPLAARVDWVTAVEPSAAMRAQLEAAGQPPNLTVIASSWEDAEPAPADLVICSHVLYAVAEPVPFIEKMEALAKERVFVCLRDVDPPEGRRPRFQDLFNLLRQMGVAPDVGYLPTETVPGVAHWRPRH